LLNFHRSQNWNEVTALYGGQFDPPHLGHREAVRGLFQNPGVKEVIILPTGHPPHKAEVTPAQLRAKMARLNFESTPDDPMPAEIHLNLIEQEKSARNPLRPSYSFDTICEFRTQIEQLAFVIGSDQVATFHTWHRFPDILNLCHWIILERKPAGNEQARRILNSWETSGLVRTKGPNQWETVATRQSVCLAPTEAKEISSTLIRESLARSGKPPTESLLPEVWKFIQEQRLYGV
jgi:nicotinate-nucleotide adenylyltransferase